MPLVRTALASHPFVAGGLALSAAIGLGLMITPDHRVAMPSLPTVPAPAVTLERVVAVTPQAPAADPRASELLLGFTLKHTAFAKLETLADQPVPRHGAWKLIEDEGVHAAIAPVAAADLPSELARWADRTVEVDSRCTAKIAGFSVVSWLVGDPAYADIPREQWRTRDVVDKGAMVLAAKLDGCGAETIYYVRDATLPHVVTLEPITDKALAEKARVRLIASAAGQATQKEWNEYHPGTRWSTDKDTRFEIQVLRHPRTGVIWVSVHGTADRECGEANVNVWGLFEIAGGKLVTVHARQLDPILTIDKLVDVDGDGELEMLGHEWLGTAHLTRSDGTVLDSLDLPFFGCPC